MSVYTSDQEQAIRVKRRADEWMRSGLIDVAQRARIAADLQVDLRRTNRFLRLTLFAFGVLIVGAATALVGVTFDVNSSASIGALCLIAAVGCVTATEFLIGRFRLYHFGIEEACAVALVVFVAAGCGWLVDSLPRDLPILVALSAGVAASFAVYWRYGYVYAAAGAMVCLALAPFQVGMLQFAQRLLAVAGLGGCATVARAARRQHGDEFPGDDYASIEAFAWLGTYAALNVHLPWAFAPSLPGWFYWLTYAITWILPAAGLWLSLRNKDRLLLDASLVMLLATILTNKSYLGAERKPWDPIVLGLVLIGAAIAIRRWLASGDDRARHGFIATRLLRSDRNALAGVGLASAAFHPAQAHAHADSPPELFDEGRSGGGGGGASY